jgi:hypothetical protein
MTIFRKCAPGGSQTYTAHAILVFSVSMYADPLAWLMRPGWRTVSESANQHRLAKVCKGKALAYWPDITRCPTALRFQLDTFFFIVKYRRKAFFWPINPSAVARTLSHGLKRRLDRSFNNIHQSLAYITTRFHEALLLPP